MPFIDNTANAVHQTLCRYLGEGSAHIVFAVSKHIIGGAIYGSFGAHSSSRLACTYVSTAHMVGIYGPQIIIYNTLAVINRQDLWFKLKDRTTIFKYIIHASGMTASVITVNFLTKETSLFKLIIDGLVCGSFGPRISLELTRNVINFTDEIVDHLLGVNE